MSPKIYETKDGIDDASADEKLCRDCARPLPLNARRCIHDNCGSYQDWRRFLGASPNLISIVTLGGVLVAILFNIYQVLDLAQRPNKEDIQAIKESVEQAIPRLKKEIEYLTTELLAVPEEFKNRYKRFLESTDTGIIKLFPRGKYEGVLLMRGGGSYYSFAMGRQEYGYGSDIELGTSKQLSVGFAGANYGFFLKLGDVAIQDIDRNRSVPNGKSEAWEHMWLYSPPHDLVGLRDEARLYQQGRSIEGTTLLGQAVAVENESYLLRSINVRNSDILVAFRVVTELEDGAFVLVWKILKRFDPPPGSEPDSTE